MDEAPRRIQREVAHRAFAQEFNASRVQIPGAGEKDPSFLVTPLGAKVNRIHVVGVCTDVEPVGESGEVWRARVSDPTGVFTVYAGNYQPEAAQAISQLQPPQFVAITGKARTYEPEPGSVFVSIRPETIAVVDEQTRDQWILDTARRTQERLQAFKAARGGATPDALAAQGIPRPLAEGAALAQQHYGLADDGRYGIAVRTALEHLRGGSVPVHRVEARAEQAPPRMDDAEPEPTPAWKPPTPAPKADPQKGAAEEALDNAVFASVQKLEGQKGARWDDILAAASTGGITPESVEEALNRLMDKGLVYEPTLGVLKST
ncbi:MAG: uncharacterized protein QOD77_1175 [Thermoplasmata archaeon]|jgi:RPA family protein|nr:uncharacterized protein [Thermoplasmata archaeon]